MDPQESRDTRYNLRPRKPKPQSPQTTRSISDPSFRKRSTPKLATTRSTAKGKGRGKKPTRRRAAGKRKMSSSSLEGGRFQRPKERVITWQHDGSLIDDPAYLPAQWDPNEYDLDENDIDGNIERCYLRIQENILPNMFQARLARYMERKAERDAIIAAAPGLPSRVAQRLDDLRAIQQDLLKNDPQEQMANVQAIIAAYLDGSLVWKRGTVTFWSYGKIVWGPGKVDWQTFDFVNKEHQGHRSFWVEECNPSSGTLYTSWNEPPGGTNYQHNKIQLNLLQMRMRIRIPGIADPFVTRVWDFLDDTGASSTGVFQCDIQELENAAQVQIQAFGHERVATANGKVCVPAYHLQARLLANNDTMLLIPWTDIKVWVMPGKPTAKIRRLSGIWPRHLLYFANVPDNEGNLYLSDNKGELFVNLPDVNVTQAIPPQWDVLEPMSDDDNMDLMI